jgi:predicted alpha/beta hydrolase family esterase
MQHQVLFIQGGGAGVHDEWDDKLVESLSRELGPGYEIRYPRMPDEANPDYSRWKAALKNELTTMGDGAILVGHSIGGAILLSVLAEEPNISIRGVFLLSAPFVGNGGWPSEDIRPMSDLGRRLSTGMRVHFYHGSKDQTAPFEHVHLYESAVPRAVVRRLDGRDHQLDNDLAEVAADIRLACARQ